MRLVGDFVLNQELNKVVSYPIYMDHFYGLSFKEHKKCNGRTRNQMGK